MRSVIRIIVAGPPGCGKGTQCEYLIAQYGLVHVSTGDILRGDLAKRNPSVREHMAKGDLLPDELIIAIVAERLQQDDCVKRGWVLDGCPRTAKQAQVLAQMGILHQADLFFIFEVDEPVLIERAVGRRVDPLTKRVYHLKFNPPSLNDGAVWKRLIHREDDTHERITDRLNNYRKHINAIMDEVAEHKAPPTLCFVRVEADWGKERVWSQVYGFIYNHLLQEEMRSDARAARRRAARLAAKISAADSAASPAPTVTAAAAAGLIRSDLACACSDGIGPVQFPRVWAGRAPALASVDSRSSKGRHNDHMLQSRTEFHNSSLELQAPAVTMRSAL